MPSYSEERKASVFKKMLPPHKLVSGRSI